MENARTSIQLPRLSKSICGKVHPAVLVITDGKDSVVLYR